ncbi:glycoside hydrolase [Xylariales sp. AK1849]|nr:glycoside hydrolase [Xylariales sp. AK1849]
MSLPTLISVLTAFASLVSARDVFAHYMVQTLNSTTTHAATDVNTALSMGLAGFALNVGDPTANWSTDAIKQVFDAAANTEFKLFFSLDLAQESDAYAFTDLINEYISNSAYYVAGSNGHPFLSTFSAAGTSASYWPAFLGTLNSEVYFVPDFDDSDDYYTDINSWMSSWSSVVDGVFSWETAWPGRSETAANVSTEVDEEILAAATSAGKDYMIGLSSLQYKHWSGNHYYRVGEVNLPQRMEEILALETQPAFVEIMTWNDAGESHYIGELWYEGLTDDILAYANNDDFGHTGWQSLISSFITAFKNGDDATRMQPRNGADMIGSMWYRTILKDASCSSDSLGRPAGAGAAKDAVNWAIVVADGVTDAAAQVWSNGVLVGKTALSSGLNYGSTPGMATGIQYLEVVDSDYTILMSTQGTVEVTEDTSGICNFNYQVAELVSRS